MLKFDKQSCVIGCLYANLLKKREDVSYNIFDYYHSLTEILGWEALDFFVINFKVEKCGWQFGLWGFWFVGYNTSLLLWLFICLGFKKTVVKLLQSKIVQDYNLMNGNYGMKPWMKWCFPIKLGFLILNTTCVWSQDYGFYFCNHCVGWQWSMYLDIMGFHFLPFKFFYQYHNVKLHTLAYGLTNYVEPLHSNQ